MCDEPASNPKPVTRLGILAAALVLVTGLAACGGDDDLADLPSVTIQPTSFVLQPVTPTNPPDDGGTSGEERASGTQNYKVESGDFIFRIAEKFEVDAEEIVNINEWADGFEHRLDPGDDVIIPPGGLLPEFHDQDDDEDESDDEDDEQDEESDDEDDSDDEDESDDAEARCPDGELQGTYELQPNDTPQRVAQSLGVTLDELNDANANTRGYSSFIVGTEILVPCEDD